VVISMTALSPEWDRWFDEAFADLIAGDPDLTRAEFAAIVGAAWHRPAPGVTADATPGPPPRTRRR
jgi:hypothetical protein